MDVALAPRSFEQGGPFQRRDGWIALSVTLLLGAVYLITYNGLMLSGGDEWVMFGMAESLVQTGTLETPQMLFLPVSHVAIGRIEALQSVLVAPIYWAAVHLPWVGSVQMVMLFPVWVTALTGGGVYLSARRLGYPVPAALAAAVGFGTATISWPYARTFFRESLLGFWLIALLFCFVTWQGRRKRSTLALCALFIALAIATKISTIAIVPCFTLILLGQLDLPRRYKVLIGLVGMLGVVGLLLLAARFRWQEDALPRLIDYGRGIFVDEQFWIRVYGLLFSPGKGLFIYAPIFVLSMVGLVGLVRRNAGAGLLILLSVVSVVCLYGYYWTWYGGMCWGPRFLVPLGPLLSLPLAQIWLLRKKKWAIAGWAIVFLSLAIQFVASTASYVPYYLSVVPDPYPDPENTVWLRPDSLLDAPVAGQFRTWSLENLDLMWLHVRPSGGLFLNGLLFAILLASLFFAGLYLAGLVRTVLSRRLRIGGAVVALSLFLASQGVLLAQGLASTRGHGGVITTDLLEVAAQTGNRDREPRVIVSYSNEPQHRLIMNALKGRFVHYWFSSQQLEGFDALLNPALPARKLWLIVDRVHLKPENSGYDLAYFLNRHLYRFANGWVGGGYEIFGYVYADHMAVEHPTAKAWLEESNPVVELRTVYLESDTVTQGQILPLAFDLYCLDRMGRNYSLFVHLVDTEGRAFPGVDGPPLLGAFPTVWWIQGDLVHDRRAYVVAPDLPPGQYRLLLGFSDESGERLPVAGAPELSERAHAVVIDEVPITIVPRGR